MSEEIKHLEAMINNAHVPEDEKQIYRNTLAKIRAAMQSNARPVQVPNEWQTSTAQPTYAPPPHPPRQQTQKREVWQVAPTINMSVPAFGSARKIVVRFPDKEPKELTEGECLGLFMSRFRDLSASKAANEGRFDKVKNSRTFARAVGYYIGMAKILGQPTPNHEQLKMRKPTGKAAQIFEMIQRSAASAGR